MDTKRLLATISLVLAAFSVPLLAKAATLYLAPSSQTVYQGDTFIVEARLNTEGKEINTVAADLVFPDLLEAVDFSEGNSILTLWPKRATIAAQGLISFVGGVPQGFIGDGLILKVTFKAKESGTALIDLGENSKVLLNDGKGTEASLMFLEGNYTIVKKSDELPRISSRTHSDQNKWYSNPTLHIGWDWSEDILYGYLLSHDPSAIPDEIPDEPEGELMWIGDMKYRNLEDGIYYFHLRQTAKNEQQELIWTPRATFRAMIDTLAPEEFTPKIGEDKAVFEGKYFLSFATKDGLSGIDHYEVQEVPRKLTRNDAKEEWKVAESPYLLEDQNLVSIIKVKAVDKAGNERIVEIIPPEKPITYSYWMIIIGFAGIVIVWWLWKRYAKYRQHKH